MSAWLEVLEAGFGNSIQDAGRYGYRHLGVAVSGFFDPLFAACANTLAGNPDGAAAIEIRSLGPSLKIRQGPVRVALSGEISATIRRHGGSQQSLAPWHSATLETGDLLKCSAITHGTAYLAVSGGICTPPQLNSRSTYQRAGIGGIKGRLLAPGDLLPCTSLANNELREYHAPPWEHATGPIRVIPGPQLSHFAQGEFARFLTQPYAITRESDRMGMRLEGPPLAHLDASHRDIISDAVTPGSLQVPGNGQPILLLADCQTVGGYPKIATVISADLPRLAQCKADDLLQFTEVGLEQARTILQQEAKRLQHWRQSIGVYLPPGYLDETALFTCNLIDGVVRADPPIRE